MSGVFASVGVIGLGQIGGSVCKALKQRTSGPVFGFDIDALTCGLAAADGVTVLPDIEAVVQQSELIVLAVPLDKYGPLVAPICAGARGTEGKVLIDVGSASLPLRQAFAQAETRCHLSIIGTHPMAGTERCGYGAAQAEMFEHRNWAVLSDGTQTPPGSTLRIVQWVLSLGARALVLEPSRHDEAVARTSHLPHLLAMALAQTVCAGPLALQRYNFAAGSFRDGTRVADSDPMLTAAMCHQNAAKLDAALGECLQLLKATQRHLREGHASSLLHDFQRARDLKTQLSQSFEQVQEEALSDDAAGMLRQLLHACREGAKIASLAPTPDAATPGWLARLERPLPLSEPASTAR